MSNYELDELKHCFEGLLSSGTEWKTEVLAPDLIIDYVPPSFRTPCGEGFINRDTGCFVLSCYERIEEQETDDSVASDEDDIYLQQCEGYDDVLFDTSALITDHLVQRKRYISETKQMVINCGDYTHLKIPRLQNTKTCPYFNDKVVYERYCDTCRVFKPLDTRTGQSLVPLVKSLNLAQECLICFKIDEVVYFLSNKETETDVDLLTISQASYPMSTDKVVELNDRLGDCTVQCLYSRYPIVPDFDKAVPHLSVQCIWKQTYDQKMEILSKPPYNCSTIINIRCVPGDPCGKHFAAYSALLTLTTHYKECDFTSPQLINKIDKLLRCEGLESDTQAELQTLGQRSDFDLTEQLYVLLCKVPDLHQQECLKHVLDYISHNSSIIPDIDTENDTTLAKLITSANDSSSNKRSIKDQIKTITMSSDWAEKMMLELGVYKLLNDYIHYFKSLDDNLQYQIQNHFYSHNGLEKLHYVVELITGIDQIFDLTQTMRFKIVKLLIDTCVKQNFNLTEVPTFRICLPSTSKFNQAKQETFDKIPMMKWSCYNHNEKKRSSTIFALNRCNIENTLDTSQADSLSVEDSVKYEVVKSSLRRFPNFPVFIDKHLKAKGVKPNKLRVQLKAKC